MTSFRSIPVPLWNSPQRGATGTPHPDRGAVDWPNAACHAGGLGHGAARTIDPQQAVAVPPAVARETGLHRAAEALQEEVKATQRQSGTGLTLGRRLEP
jgi:hypothetical protein